jgi:hypothetical protein
VDEGEHDQQDHQASVGEPKQPEHLEPEPEDVDPPQPERRLRASLDETPL